MIRKILIANRGEIACRVISTAKRMGIVTVAVYSDADAQSRHVAMADEAYRLGPAPAKESYLKGDAIIALAKQCGAQAIHPGYGFLSENEGFAQACAHAGLVFIGPPPSAIAAMGGKSASKALMEKAKVPLVPGYHGDEQAPAFLAARANEMGYPVLIKASAGGGGKGMRIVTNAGEFEAALASCKREAINSFGDDKVLIERYLTKPRHIEVQVFGDTLGNVVYLFERDCSVQRRHQKVAEEAPAPGMTPERRKAMGEAAVSAAKAVGYVGAGTVEFIAEPNGKFYFMEMNTRLQVEHPVTEMITGQDLVEWQLRVANGERLPLLQDQLAIYGHSIELRVYAENPDKGFLPSTGQLHHMAIPSASNFSLSSPVRIDAGVAQGDTITPNYDPMIAKLIVWGEDRDQALARASAALAEFEVVGLSTNLTFLKRLMRCASFTKADLDTGLIERERAALLNLPVKADARLLALVAASQLVKDGTSHAASANDPWSSRKGWRANGTAIRAMDIRSADLGQDDKAHRVSIEYHAHGYTISALGQTLSLSALQAAPLASGHTISGLLDGHRFEANAIEQGTLLSLFHLGEETAYTVPDPYAPSSDQSSSAGKLTAPMPGKVIALNVTSGASVKSGQVLLVMEAMKMEHSIHAPADGKVTELIYQAGDQVAEGAQLIGFEASK